MRIVLLFVLFIFFGCSSEYKIDVQGHRGYRGLYPENSLLGFEKALELGVHTLELDVVISQDKQVVVSHEPFMNHNIALDLYGNDISEIEETKFNLFTMPYDSIKLYDNGSKVHQRFPNQKKVVVFKPLLSDVLNLAEKKSNHNIFYNIEIKSKPEYDLIYTPDVETYVTLVLQLIKSQGISERTIIQSFDIRALEATKQQFKELKIALLIDENESIKAKLEKLSFAPDIISPYFELLTYQNVNSYQKDGFKVIPWTVNTLEDIDKMVQFKVDGIISDYPERVFQQLK